MASARGSFLLISLFVGTFGSSGSFATSFTINAPQNTPFIFTQSGDDLTIANGGSITTNSNAVRATNNTINNNIVRIFGSITTTTANDDGINLFNGADISISGSILTQGNNSEGITVVDGAIIALTSGGSITTNGTNSEALFGANNAIVTIANGATITTSGTNSDGMQFIDNANIVMNGGIDTNSGAGSEGIITRDGATIRMGATGTIDALGNGADGIFSRDDADIAVAGTLNSSRRGITTRDNSTIVITSEGSLVPQISHGIFGRNGVTIVNGGSIATIGINARGIFAGTQADISNSGTIITSGDNQAHGIFAGGSATINNSGDITVTGSRVTGNQAPNGIRTGNTSSVINSGTISTTGTNATSTGNSSHAIRVNNNSSVTNTGILNTSGAHADGIWANQNAVINSTGSIQVVGTSANGIFANDRATIANGGNISTAGTNSDGIQADDDAIIINSGSIRTLAANSDGIDADTRAQITNTGSIIAGGIGINLLGGGGSKSVVNSGRIETTTAITGSAATTGYAIRFTNNNSDDTLTLQAGSRIIGRMDMGNTGGNDTVILDRTGGDIAWRWTFEDYNPNGNDTLSVIGGPFVVEVTGDSLGSGATITVGDTSLQTSAGALLADISGTQNKLALDRISEAWALGDGGLRVDEAAESQPMWNAWARGYFSLKSRDGASASAGDTAQSQHVLSGFAAGVDRAFGEHSFFGAYASTTHTTFTYEGRDQTLTTDTVTGGAYGRLQAMNGLFADVAVAAGYMEGDAGARLRANNLVAGGIEEIEGGEADGSYISPTMRIGTEIAVSGIKFVPSATIAYAAQWREGYTETGDTVQSVGSHIVKTASGRLELAAILEHNGAVARLHGGITAQKDLSRNADFTLGTQVFDIETSADEAEFGTFAGFAFHWAMGDRWALNLDAEASLADIPEDLNADTLDLVGVNASAGLRLNF